MIDHDRLFKELLTTFFAEFVELFLPEVSRYLERDTIQFLDKEVFTDVTAGERHEADIVVKAQFRGQPSFFLIHIENQSYAQDAFGQRMFRYFARLYEKHGLPVYPVAVFSYDAPQRPEPKRFDVRFPDKLVLNFNYAVIQLNRLSWRKFVRQPNPVASALMAKMRIAPKDRPKVKLECLRLLATLRLDRARMQLISGFIDTYLSLSANEERKFQQELSQIAPQQEQEQVMQIVTSWMRQGIQQGLQEGMQTGRQEEALTFTLRLLRRKVGETDTATQNHLSALSTEQLEELGEELLNFSSKDDLTNWLQNHAPQQA